MLADKQVLCAYSFDGYWKDVGTIESLWEANMDLLSTPMPIDLHDKKWRIYAVIRAWRLTTSPRAPQ